MWKTTFKDSDSQEQSAATRDSTRFSPRPPTLIELTWIYILYILISAFYLLVHTHSNLGPAPLPTRSQVPPAGIAAGARVCANRVLPLSRTAFRTEGDQ